VRDSHELALQSGHKEKVAGREVALSAKGFTQVSEVPNLWAKDGVHISIDQVMREGLEV